MTSEHLIEVSLPSPDMFLVVMETLTRIGILGKDNDLWQSCHILHKRGRYYIVHFKEMMKLDGKTVDLSADDVDRRNFVACLLASWGLVELITPITIPDKHVTVKIVPHGDKNKYNLRQKYKVGG